MEIKFVHLLPQDMTEDEKVLLIKGMKHDYDNRTAVDLIKLVLLQRLQLWRAEGDMSGLLMTHILLTNRGRVLYVDVNLVKGSPADPPAFVAAVLDIARRAKCSWLSGLVQRPGMLKLLHDGGVPIAAHVFLKEVPSNAVQG